MLAIAAIGVIALVGAVIAGVTWRRGVDERQSVKQYQSALDTLRHVSDRIEETRTRAPARSARVARAKGGSPAGAAVARVPKTTRAKTRERTARAALDIDDADDTDAAATAAVADVPATAPRADDAAGEGDRREARAPLVFDDDAPPIPSARGADADDPAARRAIARMGGGTRHPGPGRPARAVLVAAVVLVMVVVLAAVGIALRSSPAPHRSAPARHATTPSSPPTAPAEVEPVATTASTATYSTSSNAFTVVLTASGDCWVMAVDATGKVVWTGTMAGGEVQTLTTTSGMLKVNLGAASDVTMTMQSRPVVLPTPFHSPFVATFTSSSSSA